MREEEHDYSEKYDCFGHYMKMGSIWAGDGYTDGAYHESLCSARCSRRHDCFKARQEARSKE